VRERIWGEKKKKRRKAERGGDELEEFVAGEWN